MKAVARCSPTVYLVTDSLSTAPPPVTDVGPIGQVKVEDGAADTASYEGSLQWSERSQNDAPSNLSAPPGITGVGEGKLSSPDNAVDVSRERPVLGGAPAVTDPRNDGGHSVLNASNAGAAGQDVPNGLRDSSVVPALEGDDEASPPAVPSVTAEQRALGVNLHSLPTYPDSPETLGDLRERLDRPSSEPRAQRALLAGERLPSVRASDHGSPSRLRVSPEQWQVQTPQSGRRVSCDQSAPSRCDAPTDGGGIRAGRRGPSPHPTIDSWPNGCVDPSQRSLSNPSVAGGAGQPSSSRPTYVTAAGHDVNTILDLSVENARLQATLDGKIAYIALLRSDANRWHAVSDHWLKDRVECEERHSKVMAQLTKESCQREEDARERERWWREQSTIWDKERADLKAEIQQREELLAGRDRELDAQARDLHMLRQQVSMARGVAMHARALPASQGPQPQ